ncbi:hypothetical protein DEAC_c05270 [Desulfosporosinus acididurans]|uniref:Uncharacterized protein n=1 Tax=Desulfosporosinus acididurans TaxID=476652 RepID=A0A0J1FV50_9FIRM|nr:hypothetical protein [Desulfosporosinus acididurans]KLU67315.1 hypothetical protein DEAC_c05270 [Desulfosporosinus acididurans]
MEIQAEDLKNLIEEGSKLLEMGCKVQDCRCIYWFLRGKSTLDQLGLESELLDRFRYSKELEERVNILQSVSGL